MSDSTVAERYAKAVFELAADKKLLEKVMSDLIELTKLIDGSEVLQAAINNPVLSKYSLQKAFVDILKKMKTQAVTEQFIQVLIENGRASLLSSVVSEYENLLKESKGELTAYITTAAPLTKKRIGEIEKAISKTMGKTINVVSVVDESILGGMVVKIGSKMLDASVLGGLQKLELITKNAIANC